MDYGFNGNLKFSSFFPFNLSSDNRCRYCCRSSPKLTETSNITVPEGYSHQAFTELESTNSEAIRFGQETGNSNIWITSQRQTNGKGRRGRNWVSEEGNLFASLLLKPNCTPKEAANLSFVAALAVFDTIFPLIPDNMTVECKWPNDILLNQKKIAGILLESSISQNHQLDFLVIGVGINLTHHPSILGYETTSIQSETGQFVNYSQILTQLFKNTDKWLTIWKNYKFEHIRDAWLEKAFNLEKNILVNLANESFRGIFKGLTNDGGLILEQTSGQNKIVYSGEVFPIEGNN